MDTEDWNQQMAAAEELAADGDYREAARILARLSPSSDETDEALRRIKLGWYRAHHEADGDGPRESEEELVAVIEHPPSPELEIAARYALASLYARHGERESAIEQLRQIVAVRPGFRAARQRLDELEANRDPTWVLVEALSLLRDIEPT